MQPGIEMLRNCFASLLLILSLSPALASDGSELWLGKPGPSRAGVAAPKIELRAERSQIVNSALSELENSWNFPEIKTLELELCEDSSLEGEGFKLERKGDKVKISALCDAGMLYGAFDLIRRLNTRQNIDKVVSNPSYNLRMLNHWDNLDSSVERGYAGPSIFWRSSKKQVGGKPVIAADAATEADKILWKNYARANASIGVNAAVLNNVNAPKDVLNEFTLKRAAEIADVLRPYNIRVFLSVNFASPRAFGDTDTADPLDENVRDWWRKKADEIYAAIPDFGGFLVKAHSEGLPGPQEYGRSHADGANMLADALAPHGGIVVWRCFVYGNKDADRIKLAYEEFIDLDGKFKDNVVLQVKNGPLDFQPREPFTPLFGAMKKTDLAPELQITQEYLGFSIQLVYLAPMWEEFFNSKTFTDGNPQIRVADTTDGTLFKQRRRVIAGVANIGLDKNWCGHHFAQANWYAFGRFAWDNSLTSSQIADEWIKQTFTSDSDFLNPVKDIMLRSRETAVNYMTPLGLSHLMWEGHHYGPQPWFGGKGVKSPPTHQPIYYHRADESGIGFDRTDKGSNAVSQYEKPLRDKFNNIDTCPEELLLWFHRVAWDYKLKSGRSLWEEFCFKYNSGVLEVEDFVKTWDKMRGKIDDERFCEVKDKLKRHLNDAKWWRDACLLYFQSFSKKPIPDCVEKPSKTLDDFKNMKFKM